MATPEEIRRRVEETDTTRSAKRSAAAQQVGELAKRRAAIAEQLDDIERQLGDVLASAKEVMGVDELARFTDVPAADLNRWLTARKGHRTRRKRPASDAEGHASRGVGAAATSTSCAAAAAPEPAVRRVTEVA